MGGWLNGWLEGWQDGDTDARMDEGRDTGAYGVSKFSIHLGEQGKCLVRSKM